MSDLQSKSSQNYFTVFQFLNPNGITHRKYRETPINKGFLDVSYKEIQFPFLEIFSKFEQQNRRKIAAKMAQKAKIAAKSPQKSPQKTGSKVTQKRPDEGLYIDARIGSSINNLKVYQNGNHFH
jgi:hypothetical protein